MSCHGWNSPRWPCRGRWRWPGRRSRTTGHTSSPGRGSGPTLKKPGSGVKGRPGIDDSVRRPPAWIVGDGRSLDRLDGFPGRWVGRRRRGLGFSSGVAGGHGITVSASSNGCLCVNRFGHLRRHPGRQSSSDLSVDRRRLTTRPQYQPATQRFWPGMRGRASAVPADACHARFHPAAPQQCATLEGNLSRGLHGLPRGHLKGWRRTKRTGHVAL